MALHSTSRLSNIKDSLKKYFVESLEQTEGLQVVFDKNVENIPTVQGTPVDRWVVVIMGTPDINSPLASANVKVICCSQKDSEGFKLAQTRDAVVGYLTDPDKSDGMRRIPLYKSYKDSPWELLGGMVVQEILETDSGEIANGIKVHIMNVRLRWGARS
jgi:hypothetical protein